MGISYNESGVTYNDVRYCYDGSLVVVEGRSARKNSVVDDPESRPDGVFASRPARINVYRQPSVSTGKRQWR